MLTISRTFLAKLTKNEQNYGKCDEKQAKLVKCSQNFELR